MIRKFCKTFLNRMKKVKVPRNQTKKNTGLKHDQIEIIEQYVQIESNYALIINGEYGIGKTYFYKTLVSPELKKISLLTDESKKYRPLHISLFGLKSVDEISRLIFLELYPILKNKNLKISAGIGKALLRGIMNVKSMGFLGDIDKYISDITPDSKDLINLEELIICFDDLDRKSEDLSLTDFYGYINYMVENFGIKIIIISNDNELDKDEQEEAAKLKEKVVGIHISYNPDVDITFSSILDKRYQQSYSLYYNFLCENKASIKSALKANGNNFRSLLFFLEHFKLIFSSMEEVFQRDKNFRYKKKEKQEAVLGCSLALAFEFKSGNLNKKEIKELQETSEKQITDLSLAIFNVSERQKNEGEVKGEETLSQRLKRKYSSTKNLYLFKSVILYILGVKSFKIQELINELKEQFPSESDTYPKWQRVLNRLTDGSYLDLNDKEYENLTEEMLSFVDLGRYELHQYDTIFYCATRHTNLLNYDSSELKERFKKGIDKGREQYKYIPLEYLEVSRDAENYGDRKEVVDYCIEINNQLKEKEEKERIDFLFDLFKNNFNEFRFKTESNNSDFRDLACWQFFNPEECVSIIRNMPNTDVFELSLYFKYRPVHFAQKEKACLERITELLKESTQESTSKLTDIVKDKLISELGGLIKKLNEGESKD